jgi:hypothetical protein
MAFIEERFYSCMRSFFFSSWNPLESLSTFKKAFSFLTPHWAALKQFDETQFLSLVRGESQWSSSVIGRLPKKLMLNKCQHVQDNHERQTTLAHPLKWTHSDDTLTNSLLGHLSISDTIA